ncbi:DUF4250 domain-containing protein [Fusibacter paucivorans]|uniref:DUF4250 domain-containing protein n=1 Tax=Fusibacter paucivorans TaxID=76009 RepID=A0ABS5PMV9_9FIRM|nr:DUF4250 domain-containing protein [Fusibacter paucivorans]MBS7526490.1 DUF4250 domain-containing protein [Fusibacter paucivorans]
MIPNDPYILLSFINTKLRDAYPSLEALCDDLNIVPTDLCNQLNAIGYVYRKDLRQFLSVAAQSPPSL